MSQLALQWASTRYTLHTLYGQNPWLVRGQPGFSRWKANTILPLSTASRTASAERVLAGRRCHEGRL